MATRAGTLESPAPSRRPKMTYEEFLGWDGENQHVEWVDGEVVEMPPIGGEHSEESMVLQSMLWEFVEKKDCGKLRGDPFQMKTGPSLPGRAPDIMFIANENLHRLHDNYLEGPADLAVEIISPGSRTTDSIRKLREYEQGGVREYWLVDPHRKEARFLLLGEQGRYEPMPIGADGTFHSHVLEGFWLRIEWLWQRPPLMTILKAWGFV